MGAVVQEERVRGLADEMREATEELVDPPQKRPCRKDTTMIGAHLKTKVSLAFNTLVARLGMERGRRVTVQDGVAEALLDYFAKHGMESPEALIKAVRPSSEASSASLSKSPEPTPG